VKSSHKVSAFLFDFNKNLIFYQNSVIESGMKCHGSSSGRSRIISRGRTDIANLIVAVPYIHTCLLSEHNQVDYVDCKLCARAAVTLTALITLQPN